MVLCARSIMKLLWMFSLLCLLHQERFLLKNWRINSITVSKGKFTKVAKKKRGKRQNSTVICDSTWLSVILQMFIHPPPRTCLVIVVLDSEDAKEPGIYLLAVAFQSIWEFLCIKLDVLVDKGKTFDLGVLLLGE